MNDSFVAVAFKGAHYMCVYGSPRAHFLRIANKYYAEDNSGMESQYFERAMNAPGCAFEARENTKTN